MRKTSDSFSKAQEDGDSCAIVMASSVKSEGGIEMNPVKQAFSPFGKISIAPSTFHAASA